MAIALSRTWTELGKELGVELGWTSAAVFDAQWERLWEKNRGSRAAKLYGSAETVHSTEVTCVIVKNQIFTILSNQLRNNKNKYNLKNFFNMLFSTKFKLNNAPRSKKINLLLRLLT